MMILIDFDISSKAFVKFNSINKDYKQATEFYHSIIDLDSEL